MRRAISRACPFKAALMVAATAAVLLAPGAGAQAGAGLLGPGPGLTGNDTGGIIQYTPWIRYSYREIAAYYCASWNKSSRITSVHARYGDYVGFKCFRPRGYDPVKAAAYGYTYGPAVRVRY